MNGTIANALRREQGGMRLSDRLTDIIMSEIGTCRRPRLGFFESILYARFCCSEMYGGDAFPIGLILIDGA